MKIGQDVSIQECRNEGYGVIEFKVRELFPNGRKNGMDKNAYVYFTKSYPLYVREEMGWGVGDSMMMTDVEVSWNDLQEIYHQFGHEEGINSMIGGNHNVENPNEYNLLDLANDIDMYCGLV